MKTHTQFRPCSLHFSEARLCRQLMPGAPEAPRPEPIEPGRSPEAPPVRSVGFEADKRIGDARGMTETMVNGMFMREAQFFMASVNMIPRMYPDPRIANARIASAIQIANQELLTRHQTIPGYPLYVIQPTPQGLVAVVNGSQMIPLGGPAMGPGMAVPGMPMGPGMLPPGMGMPGGGIDTPPTPIAPGAIVAIRALYLARRPERMRPEERSIWQQTLIAGLELMGYSAPANFEAAFIARPPTEQIMMARGSARAFNQMMGVIRLVIVAAMTARLRRRPGSPETLPVNPRTALEAYERNADRPIAITIEPPTGTGAITKLTMRTRGAADSLAEPKRVTPAAWKAALISKGLREGTDFTFDLATGQAELVSPTPERLQKVLDALRAITPAEIMPGTPENRINTYKDNPRRKVDVVRTPATGAPLTELKLTPKAGVAGPVTQAELRRLLTAQGIPNANIADDGTTGLTLTGAALDATNLPRVATVLETLVLPGGPEVGTDAQRSVDKMRKSRELGYEILEKRFNGTYVGAPKYMYTLPAIGGVQYNFFFREGKWMWNKAAEDPATVQNELTANPPGLAGANLTKFREVADMLKDLDSGNIVAAERISNSSRLGFRVLELRFAAVHDAPNNLYKLPAIGGVQYNFFFREGKWMWNKAAEDPATVQNELTANPPGLAGANLTKFREVADMLKDLDGGNIVAAERIDKGQKNGEELLFWRFEGEWDGAQGVYKIPAIGGVQYNFFFREGKWMWNKAAEDPATVQNELTANPPGLAGANLTKFREVADMLKQLNDGNLAASERFVEARGLGKFALENRFNGTYTAAPKYMYTLPAIGGVQYNFFFREGKWMWNKAAEDPATVQNELTANPPGLAGANLTKFREVADMLKQLNDGNLAAGVSMRNLSERGDFILLWRFDATWVRPVWKLPAIGGVQYNFFFREGKWMWNKAAEDPATVQNELTANPPGLAGANLTKFREVADAIKAI